MKAQITTEPAGIVTYTTVANHISTAVSELPDYIAKNRRVSGVTSGAPIQGILRAKDNISTGYDDNWQDLSQEDRKKVNDERSRLGISKNKGARGNGRGSPAKNKTQLEQL